ncbi:MAG: regulatory protein GemA [Desulfobacterium sp.]|nr:regulatory protein GemA [Desulfobacteraceae bacterium]MBA3035918.1 regulatory protein GemA [Desulfobacterium sp.]
MDRKKLAVLHIAKKQLGLDADTYRAALLAHGGVESSSELNEDGFLRVVKHFESCGFVSRFNPVGKRPNRPGMATDAQIKKIYAQWWSIGWAEKGREMKALRGFLQKRFRVDHENFLTFEKAHSVIEALKKIGERDGNDSRNREIDGGVSSTPKRGPEK